jgi:hypothetical protein
MTERRYCNYGTCQVLPFARREASEGPGQKARPDTVRSLTHPGHPISARYRAPPRRCIWSRIQAWRARTLAGGASTRQRFGAGNTAASRAACAGVSAAGATPKKCAAAGPMP